MRIFLMLFSVIFFFSFAGIVNAQVSDREGIVGRVVDVSGHPVAYADITYSDGPNDDMLTGAKADAEGRFELKDEPLMSAKIWITNKIERDWLDMISAGRNLPAKYLISPVIKLGDRGKAKFVNLGDVMVQAYYSPIKILVRPDWRDRVFLSGDWIGFRIMDSDGVLAEDTEIPITMNGINKNESSITMALPSGKWKIEMCTEGMPWKIVARLIVKPETPITINWPPH